MLTLHMPADLENRLRDKAAREGLDPDAFILRAVELALGGTKAGTAAQLSARESDLLGKISIGLSQDAWQRYWELRTKSDTDTLMSTERTELLGITDQIERAGATRMQHLIELAKVRNIPVENLMDQLGLGNGMEIGDGSNGG